MMPRVLRLLGTVVAPTTLLTGLLFYFGQMYVAGYCRYFGVNFTTLDLSVRDYLTRSVEGIFLPLVLAAALALVVLWLVRVVFQLLDEPTRERVLRTGLPIVAAVGAALIVLAAVALAVGGTVGDTAPELGGLSLTAGVVAVTVSVPRLLDRRRSGDVPAALRAEVAVAEWTAAFVLASVGLFWAVGSYATGIGTGRAEEMAAALPVWPDTVLYSERDLGLHAAGITQTACAGEGSAYRYRYDGLKLVLQSGGQYFFLPAGWTTADGSALVIPRTDSLRLEFSAAGTAPPDRCASSP
jgi:hypothetical protein